MKHEKKFIVSLVDSFDMEKDAKKAETWVGVCYRNGTARAIFIKKWYWNKIDSTSRKTLLFHELGHCILDLEHRDDPNNYMNPYITEDLSMWNLYNQVVADVKAHCTKQQ